MLNTTTTTGNGGSMIKWNKKICVEHITELKSPLEAIVKPQSSMGGLAEKIRAVAKRIR